MDGAGGAQRRDGTAPWPLAAPPRDAAEAAAGENFPVVGLLTRGPRARAVRAFYAFARGADDVADDPGARPAAKLARLDAFERGLDGGGAAQGAVLRAALAGLAQGERALGAARALLGAFRQDARGAAYPDWDALAAYCAMSADPVGRFLLAVHDEDPRLSRVSDPLCTALQVLNHLQDMRADRDRLGRVYLPADLLAAAGADEAQLSAPTLGPGLRRSVDDALDRCDALLARAAPLPRAVRSRALAAQAAATLHLARRLSARLRVGDPLATRVRASRADVAAAGLRGLAAAAAGRKR